MRPCRWEALSTLHWPTGNSAGWLVVSPISLVHTLLGETQAACPLVADVGPVNHGLLSLLTLLFEADLG